MTTTVRTRATPDLYHPDRPGWIPESVGDDWDPHPYAYQTREELMPAGHLHGLYLHTLLAMLKPVCDRLGLRLFIDVFVFYRDWEGRKQRIAPDALFAPARMGAEAESQHKYDLDHEPVPLCAVEVISPRSRVADQQSKRLFYAWLGIREYLLLDVEDDDEQPLPQVLITLWRVEDGVPVPVTPDAEGFLLLECLGVRLRADGRTLVAQDVATGAALLDTPELRAALTTAEQARQQAEQARQQAELAQQQAEQRAEAEAAARLRAEAELAQLRAELARRNEPGDHS